MNAWAAPWRLGHAVAPWSPVERLRASRRPCGQPRPAAGLWPPSTRPLGGGPIERHQLRERGPRHEPRGPRQRHAH